MAEVLPVPDTWPALKAFKALCGSRRRSSRGSYSGVYVDAELLDAQGVLPSRLSLLAEVRRINPVVLNGFGMSKRRLPRQRRPTASQVWCIFDDAHLNVKPRSKTET